MLNFLQENKGKSVILMLSDACGDFARGFKKVKAALADLADGLPVVSRDESVTESWGIGTDLSQTISATKNPEKNPESPIQEFCSLPRFSEPGKFLTWRKNMWGKKFGQDCVKWLLQKDLRSDNYKNTWLNGRKISQRQYKQILGKCKQFLEECQDLVFKHAHHGSFVEGVGSIHFGKWKRRHNITDARLILKDLNVYTREVHAELPSMRPMRDKKT